MTPSGRPALILASRLLHGQPPSRLLPFPLTERRARSARPFLDVPPDAGLLRPRLAASPGSAAVAAAVYPQAVALTRLLASSYWQAMSAAGSPGNRMMFSAEVRRTVALGYTWPPPDRPADPLKTWINERYLRRYSPWLFGYHAWPEPDSPTQESD